MAFFRPISKLDTLIRLSFQFECCINLYRQFWNKGWISQAFLVDGLYCVSSVCSVRSGGFEIAWYAEAIACENCWRSSSTL
ncbi:hypothetical protein VNO80_19627 [Phaseolus coccineus]|uniref:Uncharacterized protein n=1 Tax=Phaseolus coccineus TaxID=3886 RepID=A0AAN9R0V6_PHACN